MSIYTTAEKVQVIKWVYGGESYRNASALFAALFNDRPIPSPSTISRIVRLFEDTGSVNKPTRGEVEEERNVANEINILAAVNLDPNISVRQISADIGLAKSTIHRVLKKHKYRSYKYAPHQEILVSDAEKRAEFCEIMIDKCNNDENFVKNICFTDECSFTLNGSPNHQNYRFWSTENPHLYVPAHTQYPQKVNVWAGIFQNTIIGPFFIEGTLTAEKYRNMLIDDILPALSEVADDETTVWYQHDGCPAHNALIIRNLLNDAFPESWIGRGGEIPWAPRSPDFSINDFFLWPYLSSKIYSDRPHQNLESLKDKITEVCFNISPAVIANVQRHFYDRLGHCLAVNGELFEHLL